MMHLDPVVCVESVWNSTIRHTSATPPPPIKVIFQDFPEFECFRESRKQVTPLGGAAPQGQGGAASVAPPAIGFAPQAPRASLRRCPEDPGVWGKAPAAAGHQARHVQVNNSADFTTKAAPNYDERLEMSL